MHQEDYRELNLTLATLFAGDVIEPSAWPKGAPDPETFGVILRNSLLAYSGQHDLLIPQRLAAELSLDALAVEYTISSTNSVMMAQSTPLHNSLLTAECQLGGRGRRGRDWQSPFARNLAFSYGHSTDKPMEELGGLSLVVGLAVADAVNTLSSTPCALKWPNDVIVDEAKLSGILVELKPSNSRVDLVIGVGVNVDLEASDRSSVDREVTDLRTLGVNGSRTDLLISIVHSLQRFLAEFDRSGFLSFIEAFNQAHAYQGKTCAIHQGDNIITGQVEGVNVDGALVLKTENGIRSFHGGEVSLRSG